MFYHFIITILCSWYIIWIIRWKFYFSKGFLRWYPYFATAYCILTLSGQSLECMNSSKSLKILAFPFSDFLSKYNVLDLFHGLRIIKLKGKQIHCFRWVVWKRKTMIENNVVLYSLPRQIHVTITLIRNLTLFKKVTFFKKAPDSVPLLRNVTFCA